MQTMNNINNMETQNKDTVSFISGFNLKVYNSEKDRLEGIPSYEVTVKNKMTNTSLAVITGLVGNTGAQTAFTYLAVGTSSSAVSAGSTALGAELSTLGLSRAAATVSRTTTSQTNDTLSFAKTFTVSGGSTTVQEIGIFNASSSGVMLARALTGAISLVDTSQLVCTYTWQAVGN